MGIIFLVFLSSLLVYSQHYKEKIERLNLKKCEECHTTKTWSSLRKDIHKKTSFDHKKTGFDLGVQHEKLACESCHTFKTEIKNKKECKSCHFDPHKEGLTKQKAKGKTCGDCHKETTWHKTAFRHEEFSKGFVLIGKHRDATCISCHKTQNYSDASPNCVSCHKTDYVKTQWPNHRFAKFDKNCVSCHTPYGWSGARYYKHESKFPILSGKHSGFSCKSCHVNNHNFKQVTCITCHAHRKGKTDKEHEDVRGYQYNDRACLRCHPRGESY